MMVPWPGYCQSCHRRSDSPLCGDCEEWAEYEQELAETQECERLAWLESIAPDTELERGRKWRAASRVEYPYGLVGWTHAVKSVYE